MLEIISQAVGSLAKRLTKLHGNPIMAGLAEFVKHPMFHHILRFTEQHVKMKHSFDKTGWKRCSERCCRGRVHRRHHSDKCAKHRSREWRDKHPLKYAFHHLRNRAKERGKEFTLTFQEYEAFAINTDYAKLKGKTSLSLSINRKDNSKGYSASNIEAISLRENSRRQFTNMPSWMKDEMRQAELGGGLCCG